MQRLTLKRRVAVSALASAVLVGAALQAGADTAQPACPGWTDPKGDATTGQNGVPGTENAQLDIVAATFGTVGDSVVGTITTAGLSTGSSDLGDNFRFAFTVAGANVLLFVSRTAPQGQPVDLTARFYNPDNRKEGEAAAKFDVGSKTVTLSGKRSELAKVVDKPTDGQPVTGLAAETFDQVQGSIVFKYDGAPSTLTPVIGDDCGAAATSPGAASLLNAGATQAQYGDSAAVAAKLVDSDGAPLVGKVVTFTLGSSTASAPTGDDGVANTSVVVKQTAGQRVLALATEGASTSVPFTVSVERTALTASGGQGTATATLRDDDRRPIANQTVTFSAGSRKVSVRTNSSGTAKASGFSKGARVKVTFAGASGMYSAAGTSTTV